MEKITIKEIVDATGGTLLWGDEDTIIETITTDSRKSGKNMLFIPLEGETFDGHEFIRASFDNGAVASLSHKDTDAVCDKVLVRVDDTKKALGDIARFYINKYRVETLALTGSVGKTTTKDMVSSVLSRKYRVLKTQGNFNNDIGVPLTIFNLTCENNMAVLEMGMNHFGEINYLSSIARPDKAIITNVGMSHIENLGSREGILKAKMEITDFFDEKNTLFINCDDDMLSSIEKDKYSVITFGIENENAAYRAVNIKKYENSVKFDVVYEKGKCPITVNLPGTHNIYNALASFAVGKSYDMEDSDIAMGIARFLPSKMRMDIKNTGRVTLINDCYNASPASVEAAFDVLMGIKAKRHIAILGDILEMGDFAPEAHKNLGIKAADLGVDCVYTVGKNAAYINQGAEKNVICRHFEHNKNLISELGDLLEEGDAVLVKASRGMKFEQIVSAIEEMDK